MGRGLLLPRLRSRRAPRSVRRQLRQLRSREGAASGRHRLLPLQRDPRALRSARIRRRHQPPLSQSRRRHVRGRLGGVRHRAPARRVVDGVRRQQLAAHGLLRHGRGGRRFRQRRLARHLRRVRHARRACSTATITTARSARWPSPPAARSTKTASRSPAWASASATTTATAGSTSSARTSPSRCTTLYRNYGGRVHGREPPGGLGVNRKYVGFGVDFFDFDNDGWKDIFIANGHVYSQLGEPRAAPHLPPAETALPQSRQRPLRRRLRGGGRGHRVAESRTRLRLRRLRQRRRHRHHHQQSRRSADAAAQRWRQPAQSGCSIKCVGTRSNRSAIGARVKVMSGGARQIDEVMSGSSYYSQNDLRLHFGLGRAAKVDRLDVAWPSGVEGDLPRPARQPSHRHSGEARGSSAAAGSGSAPMMRLATRARLGASSCARAAVRWHPLPRRAVHRHHDRRPASTSRTPTPPPSNKYLIETMGGGVALLDYDNDGRLDMFFTNGAQLDDPQPPGKRPDKSDRKYWNRLYRQNADGTFSDVTEKAGVTRHAAGPLRHGRRRRRLRQRRLRRPLRHQLRRATPSIATTGDGTFTDVTKRAGVAAGGWSASAGFFDYDNDGRLDLFVTRYVDWSFRHNRYCGEKKPGYRAYCHPDNFNGIANVLYRNNGDGTFTDVSAKAGIADRRTARASASRSRTTTTTASSMSTWRTIPCRRSCTATRRDGTFAEVGLLAGVGVQRGRQDLRRHGRRLRRLRQRRPPRHRSSPTSPTNAIACSARTTTAASATSPILRRRRRHAAVLGLEHALLRLRQRRLERPVRRPGPRDGHDREDVAQPALSAAAAAAAQRVRPVRPGHARRGLPARLGRPRRRLRRPRQRRRHRHRRQQRRPARRRAAQRRRQSPQLAGDPRRSARARTATASAAGSTVVDRFRSDAALHDHHRRRVSFRQRQAPDGRPRRRRRGEARGDPLAVRRGADIRAT